MLSISDQSTIQIRSDSLCPRTIIRNGLWVFVFFLVSSFLQFILFVLLTHVLPRTDVDLFELGRSCLEIGVGILGSGFVTMILRENSKNIHWWMGPGRGLMSTLFWISLIFSIFLFGSVGFYQPNNYSVAVIGFFCLAVVFQIGSDTYEALFRSQNCFITPLRVGFLCHLLSFMLTLLVLRWLPFPLIWISLLIMTRWFMQFTWLKTHFHTQNNSPPEMAQPNFSAFFWDVLPVSIGTISFILYARIDVLMLEWLEEGHTVSLYAAAFRPLGLITMLVMSFYQSFTPTLSKELDRNIRQAYALVLYWGCAFAVLGLFTTALLHVVSPLLFSLLYPDSYNESILGFRILSWSLPIVFAGNAFGLFLIHNTRESSYYYAGISLGGLAVNMLGNWFLIPTYGYLGAAGMTVVTDGLTTLAMIVSSYRIIRSRPLD